MDSSKQKPRHRATLKDVATAAGVSTATVARVLHGKGYVAEETRKAVEAAIYETKYYLNAVAQGLRKQRSFLLGHVLMSIAPNPFFATVALGVDRGATMQNYGVLTINTQEDPEIERHAVEMLIRQRVDAMIFTTFCDEANVELALSMGIPVVQVERVGIQGTHQVTVDNYRGAVDAVEHLLELGHVRIAFLGEDPDAFGQTPVQQRRRMVERERLSGYCDALNSAGIGVDPALVDIGGTYYDLDYARTITRRLLSLDDPPTAIFAACDYLAAGVLQGAYALNKRVPDDVSVVGFDDTIASQLAPQVTSVAQPMLEIGQVAATIAIQALDLDQSGDIDPASFRRERLTTRLIERGSTGARPRQAP